MDYFKTVGVLAGQVYGEIYCKVGKTNISVKRKFFWSFFNSSLKEKDFKNANKWVNEQMKLLDTYCL